MTTILSGLQPIQLYGIISRNEPGYVGKFVAADPATANNIAYFSAHAASLTSVASLMKDTRALTVLLGAYGLQADLQYPALIKQVMTEDPRTTSSLAYRTGNQAYLQLGTLLGQFKTAPFASTANINSVVAAYAQNQFEASEDIVSPGIKAALHFKSSIGSITSINALMSDSKLVAVAAGGVGLTSSAYNNLTFDQQVNIMTKNITFSKFQSANYVDQFVTKYLVLNSSTGSTTDPAATGLAILQGTAISGSDLLGALFPTSGGTSGTILAAYYNQTNGSAASSNPLLSLFT